MKHRIFFVSVISLVFTSFAMSQDTLQAQQDTIYVEEIDKPDEYDVEHSFGFRAGYGVSTITFSPNRDTGYNPVFDAGLVYKRIGRAGLGIQLELNYANRGYSITDDQIEFAADTLYNFTNIEIPFLAHGYVGRKNGRLFLNVGCFLSVRLNGNRTFENQTSDVDFDRVQMFGYGVLGGLGYGRKIGPGFLQLEGRYQYALGNLYEQVVLSTDLSQMQVITVNLAYLF